MIFLAQYLHLALIAGTLVFWLLQKRAVRFNMFFFECVSLPLTLMTARIMGYFFYHPRPFVALHISPLIPHAADNGFPSDHTLLGFALGALVFTYDKRWGTVLCLLALLLGISRIYVSVHSPLDVLGSFVVSVGVLIFLQVLRKSFLKRNADGDISSL